MDPTRAPRTTRGSRTCQTMVTSIPGTDRAGCQGSRASSAWPTMAGVRSAGPTDTPMAMATTSAAMATASARLPVVDFPVVDFPVVDFPVVDFPVVDFPVVEFTGAEFTGAGL